MSLFFKNGDSPRAAARLFSERFPYKYLSHSYVLDILAKFMERDQFTIKMNIENSVRTEATGVSVLYHIRIDPTLSKRKVYNISSISLKEYLENINIIPRRPTYFPS